MQNEPRLSELLKRIEENENRDLMNCLTQDLQGWMYAHALLRGSGKGPECDLKDLRNLFDRFRLTLDMMDGPTPTQYASRSRAGSLGQEAVERQLSGTLPKRFPDHELGDE